MRCRTIIGGIVALVVLVAFSLPTEAKWFTVPARPGNVITAHNPDSYVEDCFPEDHGGESNRAVNLTEKDIVDLRLDRGTLIIGAHTSNSFCQYMIQDAIEGVGLFGHFDKPLSQYIEENGENYRYAAAESVRDLYMIISSHLNVLSKFTLRLHKSTAYFDDLFNVNKPVVCQKSAQQCGAKFLYIKNSY